MLGAGAFFPVAVLIDPVFRGLLWGIGGVGLICLWVNLRIWKYPFFPYDRILSASSIDGLHWVRDLGVRVDVADLRQTCQVYTPEIVAVPTAGVRMYYRVGGTSGVIASAWSKDGLAWAAEPGVRIGAGACHDLMAVSSPEVVHLDAGLWRMYYAGFDGTHWRIYCRQSVDGMEWQEQRLCVDVSTDVELPDVKDPSIVKEEMRYWVYFMRFSPVATGIFRAVSRDGLTWEDIRPCRGCQVEGTYVRNPCVVRLKEGWLRMYFAESPRLSAIGSRIVSAISQDGLEWEREPGVRLAPGGPYDQHGVFCPDVVPWGEGWRMYYGGYWGRHWLAPYTLFRHRAPASPG